jgi:peptidoglycan hydrolase CwlO-like protein
MDVHGTDGVTSLPQDHEEQLALGHKIIHGAFHGHKGVLKQQISNLETTVAEQRDRISALQKKNSALEVELVESHQRSNQLAEENKELFKTVGSLRKQIGRLEHLKAAVMSSIQDDAEKEAEIGDTRAFLSESYLHSATPLTAAALGYQAPPMNTSYGGNTMTSQHYNTTPGPPGQSMSPAPSQAPIDGKAFFRQARGRLSSEAFNQFLSSIKRLNNQQQSREETLGEARALFGPENNDLYVNFENLLNSQSGM